MDLLGNEASVVIAEHAVRPDHLEPLVRRAPRASAVKWASVDPWDPRVVPVPAVPMGRRVNPEMPELQAKSVTWVHEVLPVIVEPLDQWAP